MFIRKPKIVAPKTKEAKELAEKEIKNIPGVIDPKDMPQRKKLSQREKILRAQKFRQDWLTRENEAHDKVAMLDGEINGRISDIMEDNPGISPTQILEQVAQIAQRMNMPSPELAKEQEKEPKEDKKAKNK